MDGLSTTRDDFAYQLRSEGKTELAAKLEKDADNANQGYTPEINNPAVHPSLWNLGNLDFGRDYADLALRNFRNGHLLVGTLNLLDSASEIIVDFVLAMAGAACFGAAVSSISTLITTGSLTTAYVFLEINLQNNLKIVNSNLKNLWNDVSNNFSLGVKSLTDKIKNVYSNTKFLKNIPLNKISNNPKDDIFKRGYNYSSISYQKKYYSQYGKFDTSNEPIVVYDIGQGNYMLQNGHHRYKAALELGLETLKVDEIIPYSKSMELGVINLPRNLIPKE